MYLFFDTETSGLPRNWKASVRDVDNWPRLVQIAWLLYNEKEELLEQKDYIIYPDGFSIEADAVKVHGITNERASKEGVVLDGVLQAFNESVRQADCLVAHNTAFDTKIMGAEFLRNGYKNSLERKKTACTMKETTDFCRIPGRYGYKWPTLAELHHKLFDCNFEDAHNAVVDIEITAKCFWELRRKGIL